jgi:hypothetical protein
MFPGRGSGFFFPDPAMPELVERIDALVAAQAAMTAAIGELAKSIGMLAQALASEDDGPDATGSPATLDG